MKRTLIALSMFAVLAVAACTNNGTWTPMSSGRTAGEGTVTKTSSNKADKTFSESLRK